MAEEETQQEDMYAYCGVRSARRMYSGLFSSKYCSLECNAIEYYRHYAVISCFFSVFFLLTIYGIFFVLIDEYPINVEGIFQILVFTFGFFYFGYAAFVGYRGVKRERKLEESNTPVTN